MRFLLCLLYVIVPLSVSATEQQFVLDTPPYGVIEVAGYPEESYRYFGELRDAPDTFRFYLPEPSEVSLQLGKPHTVTAPRDLQLLLTRTEQRGVSEVARHRATKASWQATWNVFEAKQYDVLPPTVVQLPRGEYRVEVSAPDNRGRYVLTLGEHAGFGGNLFAAWRNLGAVNEFFGHPWYYLLVSVYVWGPALLLLGLGWWWYRRASVS